MSKKLKNSKSKARVNKRTKSKLASTITHFFETVWAVGASVAGAMVSPTTNWAERTAFRPFLIPA